MIRAPQLLSPLRSSLRSAIVATILPISPSSSPAIGSSRGHHFVPATRSLVDGDRGNSLKRHHHSSPSVKQLLLIRRRTDDDVLRLRLFFPSPLLQPLLLNSLAMNPDHDPSSVLLQPMQSAPQSSQHKASGQLTLTQLDSGSTQSGGSALSLQQHMQSQGVIVQNMGIGINGSGEKRRSSMLS